MPQAPNPPQAGDPNAPLDPLTGLPAIDISVPMPARMAVEGDHLIAIDPDPRAPEVETDKAVRTLCDNLYEDLTGKDGRRLLKTLRGVIELAMVRQGIKQRASAGALPFNSGQVVSASESLLRVRRGYPKTVGCFRGEGSSQEQSVARCVQWADWVELLGNAATVGENNITAELNGLDRFNRDVLPRLENGFPDDVFLQSDLRPAIDCIRGPAQQGQRSRAKGRSGDGPEPPAAATPPAPAAAPFIVIGGNPGDARPAAAAAAPEPPPPPRPARRRAASRRVT